MASFDEAIPPGQAGKVTATIRTEGLRGPVAKTITVTSNDPVRPTMTLTLKAVLVGSVELLPGPAMSIQVSGPAQASGPSRLLIRREPTEEGTLQVSGITSSVPWLAVTARPVGTTEPAAGGIPPAQPGDWILEAKPGADAPSGMSRVEVRFKTGLTREPEVVVPVSVSTPVAVSVFPMQRMNLQMAGKTFVAGQAKLLLRRDAAVQEEMKISDVSSTISWLQVTARRVDAPEAAGGGIPAAQPGDWILEAKPAGEAPTGMTQGEIRFQTGLTKAPRSVVPVTIYAREPIQLSTKQLMLPPPAKDGEGTRAAVFASVRQDLDKTALRAEAEPSAFHAELEQAGPSGYRVNITWTPSGADTPRQGKITLRLNETVASVQVQVGAIPAPPVPVPSKPAGAQGPAVQGKPAR